MMVDLPELLEDRVPLSSLPTPIDHCESLSRDGGIQVDLKRDDLIGEELTGTKVRALSYILRQALQDGVTDLITVGEPTSNQCRLVAILGHRHGLATHFLLRNTPGGSDERIAALRELGATVDLLDEREWRMHGLAIKRLTGRLRKEGRKALFLPFGCGEMPGPLGVIDLVREITEQHGGSFPYSHVVVPTGSGTTLFGLDLALQLEGNAETSLIGVSVAQESDSILQRIDQLYSRTGPAREKELGRTSRLTVDDSRRSMEPQALLDELARIEEVHGLAPDPHYVLRAFLSLEQLISANRLPSDSNVMFLVTGACTTRRVLQARART